MSTRSFLAIPLTALALVAAAPRAHACSPPLPGVFATLPADGEKYPGNAAVMLQGYYISPTEATVTVDGQPATLKDVSKTRFSGLGYIGVTVEPTPTEGQSVVITGTFCAPGTMCNPVTLHYQATAPDTVAPSPIELLSYDIHDYQDFKVSIGDCQIDSDFAWWLKLKGTVPTALNESPLIYAVERYDDASLAGDPVIADSGYVAASWSSSATSRGSVEGLDGKALPEAFCFRVKTYDTAGNTPSVSPVLCKPCNYRVDSVSSNGSPPAEPTWTAADAYPGGPCNSSTTVTGTGTGSASTGSGGGSGTDDDVVIGGCGCRVAGEGATASGLFGALALALGAAVRIGRRRR
jgi:MYXO-CTERM domain-containing protein